MSWALVARADQGGIAAQCWQLAKHLSPDKILVVHTTHDGRGRSKPGIFKPFCPRVRSTPYAPTPDDVRWLCDGMDSVLTVECWYGHGIPKWARDHSVKSIVLGNPEMTGQEYADVMVAHTHWRLDALPHSDVKVIPFPCDLELLPRRVLSDMEALYHVWSPAMCDRNGTELLLAACGQVRHEIQLLIRGGERKTEHSGLVSVHWLGHHDGMFYEAWPERVDAFVLPRRFGGLSLPMQEAATLGLPIISLDVAPQRSDLPPQGLVPARVEGVSGMRGGVFEIHTCDPMELSIKINQLVEDRTLAPFLADQSYAWAKETSWEVLRPEYEALLCM